MNSFLEALALVFSPGILAVIAVSSLYGLFMGAMPGLSATMAVALMVPLTFFMEPVPALAAIIATCTMAIFAGDIPAALIRMPGTPSSAAYVEDLHGLTLQGRAEYGLGACVIFSAIGGILGTIVLMIAAPILANFAASFSSDEYFWLACLGMTCAVTIYASTPLKGVMALLIGLLLATVGSEMSMNFPRYTFGSYGLVGGVGFIAALVGIFAMGEILKYAKERHSQIQPPKQVPANIFKSGASMIRKYWVNALRGSTTGIGVGILPGAGGGIATWVSYAIALRMSKPDPATGKRDPMVGIVEASSANNSGLAGTWIPTLVFGIPGDAVTAIVIGVLLLKGIVPGPAVFTDTPVLINSLLIVFFLANILMVPFGWLAIRAASFVLRMPRPVLMSLVLILSIVGSYAINNALFDVGVMLALGILAFFLQENDFPVAPIILGLVLGPIVEETLLMSLLKSRGDVMGLVDRPVAAVLAGLTLLMWTVSITVFGWRHVAQIRRRRAELRGP